MKEKTKFAIYGFAIIGACIISAYPLSLISKLGNTDLFLYGSISWAMMFFIGIGITLWTKEMNRINRKEKVN